MGHGVGPGDRDLQRVGPATSAAREVPAIAASQGGVFTAAQAIAEGWTARQVRRRLDAGRWVRVAGRGLRGAGPPGGSTARALAWAAQLTWPEAVICRRGAALVLGLPVRPASSIQVLVKDGRRPWGPLRPLPGLERAGPALSVAGLRVTHRPRTIVDCLAFLPFDEALDLYAWLVSRDQLCRADLVDEARAGFGAPGAPQLRRLLAATRGGAVSSAEARLHALLHAAGLRGWSPNAEVRADGRVIAVADVLFDAARLVVEVDGLEAHATAGQLVADLRRQNALIGAGYRVLRYTWWDVVHDASRVVAEIARAVRGPAGAV